MKSFLLTVALLYAPTAYATDLDSFHDELELDVELEGQSSQKTRVARFASLNQEELNSIILQSISKVEKDSEELEIKQGGWCGSKFLLEVGALLCTGVATGCSAVSAIKSNSDKTSDITLANNLTIISMTFTLAAGCLQFFGNQSWVSRHALVKDLNNKLRIVNSTLLEELKRKTRKFKKEFAKLSDSHQEDVNKIIENQKNRIQLLTLKSEQDQLQLEKYHELEKKDQKQRKDLYKEEFLQLANQNQILKDELIKAQNMIQIWQVSSGKQNERLTEDSKNFLKDSKATIEKLPPMPLRASFAGNLESSLSESGAVTSPRTPLRTFTKVRPESLRSKKSSLKKSGDPRVTTIFESPLVKGDVPSPRRVKAEKEKFMEELKSSDSSTKRVKRSLRKKQTIKQPEPVNSERKDEESSDKKDK